MGREMIDRIYETSDRMDYLSRIFLYFIFRTQTGDCTETEICQTRG